jgi:ectoine hydroxylase-related dioxygenase (phytanoyl-CoA dioxygenase family)
MTMTSTNPAPPALEPKTHNHLLGDFAALDEAMERDGYWFFRDVFDKDAVARLRKVYTDELEKLGVIDPVGDAPTEKSVTYNGHGDLVNMPRHMEPLADREAMQGFIAEEAIHGFLVELLGEEPFWKPVTEYRASPPAQDASPQYTTGYHQDGPPTPGVDFITMWVPVAEVDREVGGILFAEGLTQPLNRMVIDATGTNKAIPPETLPEGVWRHTTYRPGDVLFMNKWTPHSGLTNISDRFRLSFDHRVMRRGTHRPLVGEVVAIEPQKIVVKDDVIGEKTIRIDTSTYARTTHHQRLWGQAIVDEFQPGTRVIVGYAGDVATVVRPTHQA